LRFKAITSTTNIILNQTIKIAAKGTKLISAPVDSCIQRQLIPPNSYLELKNKRLAGSHTLAECGVQDGDVIDVFQELYK
jgi:hypothetical protein